MGHKTISTLRKLTLLLAVCSIFSIPQSAKPAAQAAITSTTDTVCRFGINSVWGTEGYDITSLGVGSYLDWGAVTNPELPDGVEYIRVLRVRDDLYAQTLANLPAWVEGNRGSVWVVGNEPDTTYGDQGGQDGILPEVYADRYYALARIIRQHDRSARIAFGPVVQTTPIRIRYLARAWNRLAIDSGSYSAASRLIDIWSPHSFILNEQENGWGADIPPGFENDHGDAVVITNYDDTHSITIFQQRVSAFRVWMANIGERDKPLWITEYGSLFPPIDPPGGPDYVNVSDQVTAAYMLDTFDFMLSANDAQTGLPGDGNQLVQRWYWYSLNGHRDRFGGTLYDPDNAKIATIVGEDFIAYQGNLAQPDLFPLNLSIAPISYNQDRTLVNYRLDVTVDNNQFYDATCAQLWIYDGDPNGTGTKIAGPLPASAFRANSGNALVTAYWMDVVPLEEHTLFVEVEPIGVADMNPGNNIAQFTVFTDVPKLSFLPLISR